MAELVPSAPQYPAPRITVLANMPVQQKLTLGVLLATAIALLAGAWMWSQTPDFRVLYANMNERDGGAIIAAIQQLNVPYKFVDGSGAIMVPADKVHEVRLKLAAQGLPKGGPSGFELMENPKFGTSQFLEQVNYQRALEGELARSIQSVSAVQGARVHLALSKPTVFVREQQKPSASVVLNVYPGRTLEPAQVSAIVHLVASSVPDLPVKNVTVIDQNGTLLSSVGQNTPPGLDPSQLRYVAELEQGYAKRVEAILAPVLGVGNVRAEVTADVDFSQTERAEEVYRPNGNPSEAAVRSQQNTEATSTNGAGGAAGGVPGATSNQPPANPTAPVNGQPAPTTPAAAAPPPQNVSAQKNATVNYELDKTIRHVRQPLGGVKRVSVAVVVNHRKEVDGAGKVTLKPLAEPELAKITDLVKEAVGYNKERGDTVSVMNSPFTTTTPEAVPDTPLWKSPELWHWAMTVGKHLLIAGLALYLILGVLRPLFQRLMTTRPVAAQIPPADIAAEHAAAAAAESAARLTASRKSYEERLMVAQNLATQEPKIVANVVKEWMTKE